MTRSSTIHVNGKPYYFTGKYSYSKSNIKKRLIRGREKYPKFNFTIKPYRTVGIKKRLAYVIFARKKDKR